MTNAHWTRRNLCLALAALVGMPATISRAQEIVELEWSDLVPKGQERYFQELQARIQHETTYVAGSSSQPVSSDVRTDWNGRVVKLSGFLLPLEYDGTGVTTFMLVPFVGACIHVPPPPAYQLVLVTTEQPYQSDGMFEPITVTGLFNAASTATELADAGYALVADRVVRYRG